MSALSLNNVTVAYKQGKQFLSAVRNVDLQVEPGQIYGLVGESGSGKTSLALAILRYLPENAFIRSGSIEVAGKDIMRLSPSQLRGLWRNTISLIPQHPLPSLNPSHTLGKQLLEVTDAKNKKPVFDLLNDVGLADPERIMKSYPHQLSGGMQQRIMIAMALASEPDLLIMDEPTSNLDVTTQAVILDLVKELIRKRNTAVVFISHNLGLIAQFCDRVAVLYAGELLEDASSEMLFGVPLHPYTQGLLDSVPRLGQDKALGLQPITGDLPKQDLPQGCIFEPRCPVAIDRCNERPEILQVEARRLSRCHRVSEILEDRLDIHQNFVPQVASADKEAATVLKLKDVHKRFSVKGSWWKKPEVLRAVDGVDLHLKEHTTLGLVGESGSGKTTLARCIIGLYEISQGKMELLEMPLARDINKRDKAVLQKLQMVFQTAEALNPYRSVGQMLRRPLMHLAGKTRKEANETLEALLSAVKLPIAYAKRLPAELSGGEKQRVAIARAFASDPSLLVFDESVSGLDVSVQAAIINLLTSLQEKRKTSYLFVSHDLSVVSYLADEVAVMYLGHLMEVGPSHAVLKPPYHPYTEALLSAVPKFDDPKQDRIRLVGEVPSPVDMPSGCRFHTRCPRVLGDICRNQEPPWQEHESGKRIYCHIPLDDLLAPRLSHQKDTVND